MTVNPNQACQPNIFTINSGSISRGGSADKPKSGLSKEMKIISRLKPSSSSTTMLQRSAQILSPIKFISNPAAQCYHSSRTTYLHQFPNPNQPLKQKFFEKAVQRPSTHPSMAQPAIILGHEKNILRTNQMSHLQYQQPLMQQSNTSLFQYGQHQMVQPLQNFQLNQNQQQLRFPQPIGPSHVLIPEGGWNRVQGLMIGEGQGRPQEHRQGNISASLPAVVFATPNQFPSDEAWREYAFKQIVQMKERYLRELLQMHKKVLHLSTQETNMEIVKKYENLKEILEKIILFLRISKVEMIPKNNERVHNYMNFIVNYLTSFMNNIGCSSQNFDQVHQQVRKPIISLSQGVVNPEANMVNMKQKPSNGPSSSQKGSQLEPNYDHIKSQDMMPPDPSQGMANEEANMMNFNHNFALRRPPGRMPK